MTAVGVIMAWGAYECRLIKDRGLAQAWIMGAGLDSGAVDEYQVGEPPLPPWHVRLWCRPPLFPGGPSSVGYVKLNAAKFDAHYRPEELRRLFSEAKIEAVSTH